MRRVLCLISNMNAGGAETYLMKLYRSWDRNQYQMDFCVNVWGNNYYEDEINLLGGKIYRIPSRTENYIQHNKQLRMIIQKYQYKYVLVVSSSATAYLDLKVAKKAGATICAVRSSNSNIGSSRLKRVLQAMLRIAYMKYANVLMAPSDLAAENMFGKQYQKDKRFVYQRNGLNLSTYSYSESKRTSIRQEFGIRDDEVLVGHVGRFFLQKNHKFLINIFNMMLQLQPNCKLMLVGTGELESEIKCMIHNLDIDDKVVFTGVRPDVPDLLSAMDIFVFPSFFEGMPNTVVEAQAVGLPCLISDTITKDVRITERVYFMSLNCNEKKWAEKAIGILGQHEDRNTTYQLIDSGYDIGACMKTFINSIFGDNKQV